MATDPTMMVDMMKKNLSGIVPQVSVGAKAPALLYVRFRTATLPLLAATWGMRGLALRLRAWQGAFCIEPALQAHAAGAQLFSRCTPLDS
eukprot:scaffold204189_cov21-Tisochrysis_lutea.AAC.1